MAGRPELRRFGHLALDALISKLSGRIDVTGWTMMFIFQLLAFGIIMLTLGLLGAYLGAPLTRPAAVLPI